MSMFYIWCCPHIYIYIIYNIIIYEGSQILLHNDGSLIHFVQLYKVNILSCTILSYGNDGSLIHFVQLNIFFLLFF